MGEVPLGIIIPVYNEAENIGRTLTTIEEKVKTPHRIYIVYDFAEDNTLPAVKDFIRQGVNLKLVRNQTRGVINAIKTGLKKAEEEFLLVTMADLSDDYAVVDKMYGLICKGYDVVCGSRYMKGGRQIGGPIIKKNLSRIADVSLRRIAGIPTHDATNSFKLYRKQVIDSLKIESDGGFEIGMEIVVKAHFSGFKVAEVPCTWTDREKGSSRFMILKWMPKYLRWYSYAVKKRFFFST